MLPTDKRRKKKLHGESCKAVKVHGESCKTVKVQLQSISVLPLANFEETNDPSPYLLLLLLFETLQHSSMSEK